MPPELSDLLERLLSSLSRAHAILVSRVQEEVSSRLDRYARVADFAAPVKDVERLFLKAAGQLPTDEQDKAMRALIATLALELSSRVEEMNLPESILAVYPDAFRRLADFLRTPSGGRYDSNGEFFRKDVRFVLGLSVPCGARVVDLASRVPLHTALWSSFRSGDISGLLRYVRVGGMGPWFRNHADSRYLSEYNEQAHDVFYARVADLLQRHGNVRGLVGTSWYYDPQVRTISPRLAYLQDRPRERGAFFLRHGTKPSEVANATKTSHTRRRLYQEGVYTPVSYSMLWPRRELITWADTWARRDGTAAGGREHTHGL